MINVSQAVILCGGLGSRLKELTAATPKPLLPVAGRPFLEILIEEVAQQGIVDFLLLAAFESLQIHDFANAVPGRLGLDLHIKVVVEPERAGTGGALLNAAPHLDDVFFLLNGDSWFDHPIADLRALLSAHGEALGVIALRGLDDVGRFGTVTLEGEHIRAFLPKSETRGPGLVNSGVYLFRKSLISYLPANGSLEQETLTRLAADGCLVGFAAEPYFIDIGIPEDYARAQTEIPAQRLKGPYV